MILQNKNKTEEFLGQEDIHRQWVNTYRTSDNERFYEEALDFIVARLENRPETSRILDIGCGSCSQSLRLARRHFQVLGIDLSPAVLKMAEKTVAEKGFSHQIRLEQQNLTAMTFADNSIDCALAWGVFMHVPDIEKAIAEVSRVLKRGGELAVSEGNMHSIESIFFRTIRRLMGGSKIRFNATPAGMESWIQMSTGSFLSRHSRISWMIHEFSKHGLELKVRHPGQFTESYARFSNPTIRRLIHRWNHFWFHRVKNSSLAYGNILIFRKTR